MSKGFNVDFTISAEELTPKMTTELLTNINLFKKCFTEVSSQFIDRFVDSSIKNINPSTHITTQISKQLFLTSVNKEGISKFTNIDLEKYYKDAIKEEVMAESGFTSRIDKEIYNKYNKSKKSPKI